MVTAETAMALPALLLVLGFAVSVQCVVSARSACADAAGVGARAAARGESDAVVADAVRHALARTSDVRVTRSDGWVRVEVVARPTVVTERVPVPLVTATAVAADEGAS